MTAAPTAANRALPTGAERAGQSIEFSSINKSFGATPVLRDFSLQIAAGEFVALLGPSGCGKSTALRILGGFEKPGSGDVLVNGVSIVDLPPNQRGIGMVFQSYSLFPNLTVGKNIEFGLSLRRVPKAERRTAVRELLEMVRLGGFADRYPAQLSGGQQQRVALARALAVRPGILLLDEPLSALDAQVRSGLREEIRELQRRTGVTVVFVTHDQEEALAMADRVAVMRDGRIEQIAAPSELFFRPGQEFVAGFVGVTNELPIPCGEPTPQYWRPPVTGGDTVFVRPDALVCEPSLNPVGTVTSHLFLGSTTRVSVQSLDGRHLIKVDTPTHAVLTVPVGEKVAIRFVQPPIYRVPEAGQCPTADPVPEVAVAPARKTARLQRTR